MKTNTPLHIFKTGTQTDMRGTVLTFSEADLAACAAAYDPAVHEAPIVIGHPKTDDPAWGWVASLKSDGTGLFAEPSQVDPAFSELVDAGRYKKISASFYLPDSPANPVPGVYYLRHVGFLGAQPPSIKGLKQVEFSEADEGVIEFADWDDVVNASMWRQFREWIIGKFGLEEADKAIPSWQVSTLEDEARKPEPDVSDSLKPFPAFAETPAQENTVSPEEAQRLATENAALKAKLAAADLTQRTTDFSEFLSGLVTAGKVLPVEQADLLNFAQSLDVAQTVEFGEGDAKVTHNHLDAFKQLLSARPVVVDFSEHAKGELNTVDLNDPYAIKAAAHALQAEAEGKGQTLNYSEAVSKVVHG